MDETYKNYLFDVATYIKERALKARLERDRAVGDTRTYEAGRLMGFNEVISILQQHAAVFGISLDEFGLADIDPDRDLL